jgi:hypothetical protein
LDGGEQEGDEHADDADHDQQLDQRKALSLSIPGSHTCGLPGEVIWDDVRRNSDYRKKRTPFPALSWQIASFCFPTPARTAGLVGVGRMDRSCRTLRRALSAKRGKKSTNFLERSSDVLPEWGR